MRKRRFVGVILALFLASVTLPGGGSTPSASAQVSAVTSKMIQFDFGPGAVEAGYTQVLESTVYTTARGYGFGDVAQVTSVDRGATDRLRSDYCAPTGTTFNVDLPNADYRVTVIAGDYNRALAMNVVAEGLSKLSGLTAVAGSFVEQSFTISLIDGQLNLEFSGKTPMINAITITKLADRNPGEKPTVYIVGDSTVQTYSASYAPQAGWGQYIANYFNNQVNFDNRAIGGRSSKTFITEGRLDEILSEIKPNDYLFVQMGHNDATPSRPLRYTQPYTTYQHYLKMYVDGARQRHAIPVLITPMARLHYVNGVFLDDFTDYCIAMLQLAANEKVTCIDLMTPSLNYLTSLGYDNAATLFMISANGTDLTHFTAKGANIIASMVAGGVRQSKLQLAWKVTKSFTPIHQCNTAVMPLTYSFDFGPGNAAAGYTKVEATTEYTSVLGYGLVGSGNVTGTDCGAPDELTGDFISSSNAIDFSVDLPSGKYYVTVDSGNYTTSTLTQTRVYAEGLLQMVGLGARAQQVGHGTFPVKVTDGQLNLEFTGSPAYVNAVKIVRDDCLDTRPTLFIAGDSTVANYFPYSAPQAGWGQMLHNYFNDGIRIDNHAIGGRSSKSFIVEGSLSAILDRMKSGDYLLIQFGHNDASTIAGRHTEPYGDYKTYLAQYIDSARAIGVTPILITPVGRRSYDSDGVFKNDFPDYCAAMKEVAAAKKVPLIDLMSVSLDYYNSLGIEGSKSVFLWLDAGESENFPTGVSDNTHFKAYGATRIAGLLVWELRKLGIEKLQKYRMWYGNPFAFFDSCF